MCDLLWSDPEETKNGKHHLTKQVGEFHQEEQDGHGVVM